MNPPTGNNSPSIFRMFQNKFVKGSITKNGDEVNLPKATTFITVVELEKVLSELKLQDDPQGKYQDRGTQLLKAYLMKNEPSFVTVMEFRDRGWNQNKEKGDAFFQQQRERADKTDVDGEYKFYTMMMQVGEEMDRTTGAFSTCVIPASRIKVLDLCMAPGGYSAAVIKLHKSKANIFAVTLPKDKGGHKLVVPMGRLCACKFLDITMLADEFTTLEIPQAHPDYKNFVEGRLWEKLRFDLVLCDGMVLRTHERASYREETEATRLSMAQLIFGMQRIVMGGTFVMLLHKIDSWASASILYHFDQFAKVQVFKPAKKHATRSSFYMIAKNVNPFHPVAVAAVKGWRRAWWMATFGGDAGTGVKLVPRDDSVLEVLQSFGPRLMELGTPIWNIQANALSMTDYAGCG